MADRELGIAIIAAPGDNAEGIARAIVGRRLAACAQVTGEVASVYWWKGQVEEAKERLIILKTEKSLVSSIRDELRSLHPYEVPELVFLPITAGNPEYMTWLSETIFKNI
ncbi:MAG TPA: divalent-cation tolerance protein CutA [Spirochaetia bacterium]|nr:divalent-cation tolerance protein CutA [Spirochaetia bacterium]